MVFEGAFQSIVDYTAGPSGDYYLIGPFHFEQTSRATTESPTYDPDSVTDTCEGDGTPGQFWTEAGFSIWSITPDGNLPNLTVREYDPNGCSTGASVYETDDVVTYHGFSLQYTPNFTTGGTAVSGAVVRVAGLGQPVSDCDFVNDIFGETGAWAGTLCLWADVPWYSYARYQYLEGTRDYRWDGVLYSMKELLPKTLDRGGYRYELVGFRLGTGSGGPGTKFTFYALARRTGPSP